MKLEDEEIKLDLWDTAGQEEYERLRTLSYPNTNVFLVCFSVDSPDSFDNVRTRWINEIRHFQATTPVLLVGLKTDLRHDEATLARLEDLGRKVTTAAQGQKLARTIHAVKYVECSSLTQNGLKEVFSEAIVAGLNGPVPQKRKPKCALL